MPAHMDVFLALCACGASLALGLGMCRRSWALPCALMAIAAAVCCVLGGVAVPGERTLTITHTFAAYGQGSFDVVARHFPVDEVRAPGWQWPLPLLGWCAVFAVWLLRWSRRAGSPHPLVPLLLAWSGTAVWLGMQVLAAPAAVVQPFGLERYLLPGCIALAVALSMRAERFFPLLFLLSLGTFAARLPAAVFSKLASDRHWGTGLDVHTITAFVDPFQRTEVEVESGSAVQQAWLIWAQHLLILPGVYLCSLAGVALMLFVWRKHPSGP
jgi:hypothetical protein